MDDHDITVVIRSAQDRTASVCSYLVGKLFSGDRVYSIEERPFSAAVRAALAIGAERSRPWTMVVDADVLISAGGVAALCNAAEAAPDNFFAVQGLILDKFFPVFRPSGIHMYRTSLIDTALRCIPAEGTSLRPESDMIDSMAQMGCPWLQCDAVVGVHDFEQYYADIFRKCFVHAHKHQSVIGRAEAYWREHLDRDYDFQVALWGSALGKLHTGPVAIDKQCAERQFCEVASIKGIEEKPELSTGGDDAVADKILGAYDRDSFAELQAAFFRKERWNMVHRYDAETNDKGAARRIPFVRKVLSAAGAGLIALGKRLQCQ